MIRGLSALYSGEFVWFPIVIATSYSRIGLRAEYVIAGWNQNSHSTAPMRYTGEARWYASIEHWEPRNEAGRQVGRCHEVKNENRKQKGNVERLRMRFGSRMLGKEAGGMKVVIPFHRGWGG